MTVRQWVLERRALLRRLLTVPMLWRLAVRLIKKHIEHDDSQHCLVCAAIARANRLLHVPMMNLDRRLCCNKCGLLIHQWMGQPKCTGKGPKQGLAEHRPPSVIVFPVNWE